jgi:hypothetical protein
MEDIAGISSPYKAERELNGAAYESALSRQHPDSFTHPSNKDSRLSLQNPPQQKIQRGGL